MSTARDQAADAVRAACIAVVGGPLSQQARLEDVADSLQRTEIVLELEEALGCELPDLEFQVETVADLVDAVEQAMAEKGAER